MITHTQLMNWQASQIANIRVLDRTGKHVSIQVTLKEHNSSAREWKIAYLRHVGKEIEIIKEFEAWVSEGLIEKWHSGHGTPVIPDWNPFADTYSWTCSGWKKKECAQRAVDAQFYCVDCLTAKLLNK